nr:uncharacterized protein C7orf26 homolog isoform X1 [Onthophagus taurus]XP_022915741.1 uncharacterized protein C7orf26 homolog isoform X2 [Onthophagus taurus]
MSGQEIKSSLRKMDFPQCTQEALNKIGQLICGKVPSLKQMDLALDLISEFVFCEVDKRGNKIAPLNPLKELQLIEVLFDYFNGIQTESHRNTVFLSIFSGTTFALRSVILSRLISIAIGMPSEPVLVSASAWMQQLGNTSINCNKLAESVIRDYFVLVPNGAQRLNLLSNCAPQFVANFLTAVSEIYFTDIKGTINFPPESLLNAVTNWIEGNYKLCIAAQQNPSVLPPGAIAMETTTPIAGLLKWCILAPIFNQNSNLYSRLHLALLNSLLEIPIVSPPRAVSAKHLTTSVGYLCRFTMDIKTRRKKDDTDTIIFDLNEMLILALDRYAQAVQVALSVKCVYGNIGDLISQLCQLPQHKILSIVICSHQVNK